MCTLQIKKWFPNMSILSFFILLTPLSTVEYPKLNNYHLLSLKYWLNYFPGVVVVNSEGIMVKSTLESSLSAQVTFSIVFCIFWYFVLCDIWYFLIFGKSETKCVVSLDVQLVFGSLIFSKKLFILLFLVNLIRIKKKHLVEIK
jgi:hypothetical protein